MVYGSDHAYHIKPPKTERSDRYIDIQRDLVEKIFAQGYVTRFTPKGIEKRFRTILRHAGIPHYRFHDLRHFCISELLLQGLPESYVSERSGHTSHATMQRYIHVLGNRRAEASKKILAHFDDVLG
jgi:integrase